MLFPKNVYILNVEKNKATYNYNSSQAFKMSLTVHMVYANKSKINFYDSINV